MYRGSAAPSLVGRYVYGDFVSGRIWALTVQGDVALANDEIASVTNPSSFGEDAAGELYVTSFDGKIYRLANGGD